MRVAGVDVWSRRWIAVFVEDGAVAGVDVFGNLADLADDGLVGIAVDIPIVLPERAPRPADVMARKAVVRRSSSVFNPPPLSVLEKPTYQEALEFSRSEFGVGISAQSYALRERILDARAVALGDGRFVEAHPEVSFATMAGGALAFGKKSWNGIAERKQLLKGEGMELPDTLDDVPGTAPPDDLLDAVACAWTALRWANGQANSLPEGATAGDPAIWA